MNQRRYIPAAYLATGIPAFLYIVIRAVTVGITYDEVWTINGFVSQELMDIINYTPCDANNHIINTLLIKLFFGFGSQAVFVARLPNVLAFLLYAFYGYRLLNRFAPPFAGFAGFLLLLLNPFLLDFFSLARGYGLSLGFLMASLYYAIAFCYELRPPLLVKSLAFGGLAVLSNFSVLNYWLGLAGVLNLVSFFQVPRKDYRKFFLISFIHAAALCSILYEPIRKLKSNGNLYYGGDRDFYHDTLISLTKYSLYDPRENNTTSYVLNAFLIVFLSVVAGAYGVHRKKAPARQFLLATLALCVLSTVLQHYLLHTLYLIDRTALFFFPLFILAFVCCVSLLPSVVRTVVSSVLVLAFAINFTSHANFYKTATWYFDAHSLAILSRIDQEGRAQHKKMKIDFSWPFESSFGYYLKKGNFPFIDNVKNPHDRDDLNTRADYYIYLGKSLEKVGYDTATQKILKMPKDTSWYFSNEAVVVYRINAAM